MGKVTLEMLAGDAGNYETADDQFVENCRVDVIIKRGKLTSDLANSGICPRTGETISLWGIICQKDQSPCEMRTTLHVL